MSTYIENGVICLGKSNYEMEQNLSEIIRFINYQLPLNHDAMKLLYDHIKVPVIFDDEDDDNYDHNDYYRWNLKFVSNYEKDGEYIYDYDNDINIDCYENKELIIELRNYLESKSPKKLHISNYNKIKIYNPHGINHDARGVRFMDWKLHFWQSFKVHNDNGITLHDLIIATHKTRSHKFETNYEMFCGVESVCIDNRKLRISANYDHGS